MNQKKNKKLSKNDISRIHNRYLEVMEALEYYSLDELKLIFNNSKMSNTDKFAIVELVKKKMNNE